MAARSGSKKAGTSSLISSNAYCSPSELPQAGAPDDLLKNGLIRGEFIFGCNKHHVKQALIVDARHDPYDLGGRVRRRLADHDRAESGFVADRGKALRARND